MVSGVSSSQKVRLTCPSFGFSGLLAPLRQTNGVTFPYTPTIQLGHAANYGTYDITHSVYQQQYFINTPNPSISVTATFTAQTTGEAAYSAAALHFFKSATKPEFGGTFSSRAGVPPHVMNFSAYGALHMQNVPVVVKSFTYTLTEESDYVTFNSAVGEVSLPTIFIVSLDLGVQYPPSTVKRSYSLTSYKSGTGLKRGFI